MSRSSFALDAAQQPVYQLLVDGAWVAGKGPRHAVRDKYTGKTVASMTLADDVQVQQTVACAQAAFKRGAPVAYERGAVLDRAAVLVEARLDAKGVVRDARVLSGPDELRAAAMKSVLDWHYSTEKGAPPIVEIAIDFKLPENRPVSKPASHVVGTLTSIDFKGVPTELREKILEKIAVKEGDNITAESRARVMQAVKNVDAHLRTGIFSSQHSVKIVVTMPPLNPMASFPVTGDRAASVTTVPRTAMPGQIRVGGNVQQSKLVQQPRPVYPPVAKQAGVQGVVRMQVVIAKDGTIKNIELESGHPLLVPSAMEAVRQWVYQPTLLNGEPVEILTTVDVNYTLAP